MTGDGPLIHGKSINDKNRKLCGIPLAGEPMSHVSRNLMKHDRTRQKGQAV